MPEALFRKERLMRWGRVAAVLVVCTGTGCRKKTPQPAPTPGAGPSLEEALEARKHRMVARVQGEVITEAQLDRELERRDQMLGSGTARPGSPEAQIRLRQILQNMIIERLLVLQAKREEMQVPQDAVDREVAIAEAKVGEGTVFDQSLSIAGHTRESFAEKVRERLMVEALVRRYEDQVRSTDAMNDEEYWQKHPDEFLLPERVRAAHILLRCESGPQCLAKATELKSRIESGDLAFEAAAREFSEDPGTRERGGDLGFFRRGDMVPAFEKVAFELEAGRISNPVTTEYGVHLVQVLERREEGPATLDEAKDILALRRQRGVTAQARQRIMEAIHDAFEVEFAEDYAPYFPDGNVFAPLNAPLQAPPTEAAPQEDETPHPPVEEEAPQEDRS